MADAQAIGDVCASPIQRCCRFHIHTSFPAAGSAKMYYWDSYFTMLGLEQAGNHDLAVDMLADFAFEIGQYGHVPNGNRSYYLSRSQPPFFSLIVELIAHTDGRSHIRQVS